MSSSSSSDLLANEHPGEARGQAATSASPAPAPPSSQGSGCSDNSLIVEDDDFRDRLFRGSYLLCRIRVSPDEVADSTEPEPMYALVSRYGYFASLYERLHAQFKGCLAPRFGSQAQPLSEVWIESSERFRFRGQIESSAGNGEGPALRGVGVALDWRVPIGVHWDSLFGADSRSELEDSRGGGGILSATRHVAGARRSSVGGGTSSASASTRVRRNDVGMASPARQNQAISGGSAACTGPVAVLREALWRQEAPPGCVTGGPSTRTVAPRPVEVNHLAGEEVESGLMSQHNSGTSASSSSTASACAAAGAAPAPRPFHRTTSSVSPGGDELLALLQRERCEHIWQLTVHFRAPSEVIGGDDEAAQESFAQSAFDEQGYRDCYLNALRKAIFLWHGNSNAFMRLPMQAQLELLDTVKRCRFPRYRQILRDGLPYPKSWRLWRGVPLKFHFARTAHTFLTCCEPFAAEAGGIIARGGREGGSRPPSTTPVAGAAGASSGAGGAEQGNAEPASENMSFRSGASGSGALSTDGEQAQGPPRLLRAVTLGEVVRQKLPFLCSESGSGAAADEGDACAAGGLQKEMNWMYRFWMLGLDVRLDTPIHWLAVHCTNLDQYLHIVVAPR